MKKKHSTDPFGYTRHSGFRSDFVSGSSVSGKMERGMGCVSRRKISVNVGYYVS